MINFQNIPPVTKNLIILNVVVFALQNFIPDFTFNFALHFFKSPDFQPYQLISHMFMHGGFTHLLFNMFGVYMFGSAIESRLGDKKFLLFYLITGFGAVVLHMGSQMLENHEMANQLSVWYAEARISDQQLSNGYYNTFNITVGASGALFGLLTAFGLLFPNQQIFLMFIPVPIKAKYFVLLYAGYELFQGLQGSSGDNIAHFAHLGGALFGLLIIKEWKKKNLI
ncbi:rhomboid family intramembrane serine protease [Flavobacteriales bacterium]|nr:rhomboid family intramembrane serine protease [Flavobacteriales bacterium]